MTISRRVVSTMAYGSSDPSSNPTIGNNFITQTKVLSRCLVKNLHHLTWSHKTLLRSRFWHWTFSTAVEKRSFSKKGGENFEVVQHNFPKPIFSGAFIGVMTPHSTRKYSYHEKIFLSVGGPLKNFQMGWILRKKVNFLKSAQKIDTNLA